MAHVNPSDIVLLSQENENLFYLLDVLSLHVSCKF